MTRARPTLTRYYDVALAPEAWRDAGCVTADDFLVLQDVMNLLAVEGTPYERGRGPHSVTVAGLEVHYTRDDVARTLTLHRVVRALEQPGSAY
ncbi:hypothetical protein [Stigmatella hybrida]|uniref:hypothetical protein n=1 Tax=Stigmatella hybrida TaxID=394097 RepID=UPI001CDA97B0|nr:hypothetical protein [Stigmatella hybrida]